MIGSAPNVGRERWVALSLLVSKKSDVMNDDLFRIPNLTRLDSNERFERLFAAVNRNGKQVRKAPAKLDAKAWAPADKSVSVTVKRTARKATVTLGHKDGLRFADFITGQLDDLYEAFRKPAK